MYSHEYNEMVEAGVAVELDTPQWKDKDGLNVGEENAYGCRCTHDLIHPDYFVVMDEVGGNINMKGDGHIGGEKYFCP